ncbi:hypothetical protein J7T55_000019 [Diaporthe amygdali]|uniref:uncharacterized protein n=1 Tax=Phomopsis amygdali TaxID=1214568 RepID=UPI0022FEB56C|nr:uncharacterized protein J7T55_000019 [Diaporthe amygdali]KAJ0107757.1 hypothetical protein J7T55_000019 [Diaporthe amygdali]
MSTSSTSKPSSVRTSKSSNSTSIRSSKKSNGSRASYSRSSTDNRSATLERGQNQHQWRQTATFGGTILDQTSEKNRPVSQAPSSGRNSQETSTSLPVQNSKSSIRTGSSGSSSMRSGDDETDGFTALTPRVQSERNAAADRARRQALELQRQEEQRQRERLDRERAEERRRLGEQKPVDVGKASTAQKSYRVAWERAEMERLSQNDSGYARCPAVPKEHINDFQARASFDQPNSPSSPLRYHECDEWIAGMAHVDIDAMLMSCGPVERPSTLHEYDSECTSTPLLTPTAGKQIRSLV